MVWFQCESCGDTLKKPKLAGHFGRCAAEWFTCVDCQQGFDRWTVAQHVTCVTEYEKYALGATKPGGVAAAGGPREAQASTAAPSTAATGLEFLATRAPWVCLCCNVTCTSKDTLLGHAQGKKHRSKARAASGTAAAPPSTEAEAPAVPPPAEPAAAEAPDERAGEEPSKGKKRKAKEAAGSDGSAGSGKEIKCWKKLATAELKRVGKPVKRKALRVALVAAARAKGLGDGRTDDDLGAEALDRIASSSQFVVAGKVVSLSAGK